MIAANLIPVLSSLLWKEDIRAGNPVYIFLLDWVGPVARFLFAVSLGVVFFLGCCLSFPLIYGSLGMFLNEFFYLFVTLQ